MISFDQAHYLGSAVLIVISLLGGYVLLLRIREYARESPDPKLTYTLRSEHEKLRQSLSEYQKEYRLDVERLRQVQHQDKDRTHQHITLHHGEIASHEARLNLLQQQIIELSRRLDQYHA